MANQEDPVEPHHGAAKKHPFTQLVGGGYKKSLALVTAATLLVIGAVHLTGRSGEISYVLPAVSLSASSVLSGLWIPLLVVEAAVGIALFVTDRFPGRLRETVRSSSRQLGHLETFFTWITLALVVSRGFAQQAVALAFVVGFGPHAVDFVGFSLSPRPIKTKADLGFERRVYFYVFTLMGIALLALLAPAQREKLAPLSVAVCTGVVLRIVWWLRHRSSEERAGSATTSERTGAAAWVDRAVIFVGCVAGIAIPGSGFYREARAHAADDEARRTGHCTPSAAPDRVDVSLFLVSDSQFHKLDGIRSGFHLDLVDALVPVTVRPTELDLLSGVTLGHFLQMFLAIAEGRPGMKWAHVGDIADLGCRDEIIRFLENMTPPLRASLAGIAVGNHDVTFLGNLDWHPDWHPVCAGRPADRAWTQSVLAPLGPAASEVSDVDAPFFARISEIGTSEGKRVVAVFVDTNDYSSTHLGIAGLAGAISNRQEKWIRSKLRAHPSDLVVLLMHHPYDALSPFNGREAIAHIAEDLGDRLLAVVSAHNHVGVKRHHCLGGRVVSEFMVSSTIDSPQEAAILDIGPSPRGPIARLRTIPAIVRPDAICPSADGPLRHEVSAATCERLVNGLRKEPACAELFGARGAIEERAGIDAACSRFLKRRGASADVHAESPEELECMQEANAWRLMKCVLNDKNGDYVAGSPLAFSHLFDDFDNDAFGIKRPKPHEAGQAPELLLCLSWAASVEQGHKAQHWSFAEALSNAFGVDSVPAAVEMSSQPGERCE